VKISRCLKSYFANTLAHHNLSEIFLVFIVQPLCLLWKGRKIPINYFVAQNRASEDAVPNKVKFYRNFYVWYPDVQSLPA
jgi:hypothetical protein